jgi:hypothetical protein
MRRVAILVALVGVVVLLPGGAHARGYRRGGTVVTPFGPLYSTNTPEWRQAGGNMILYQQLMEQKMMLQQQQMMMKTQQQMMKLQQQKGKLPNGPATNPNPIVTLPAPRARKKAKRRTCVPQGTSASAAGKAETKGAAAGSKASGVP